MGGFAAVQAQHITLSTYCTLIAEIRSVTSVCCLSFGTYSLSARLLYNFSCFGAFFGLYRRLQGRLGDLLRLLNLCFHTSDSVGNRLPVASLLVSRWNGLHGARRASMVVSHGFSWSRSVS
ncbi:hypothetical protein PF005_g30805 [Phytophthora fragariae]|uniref:Uncharacterized protein n=1 Tax=Phytophthora fragariae TaxID=53985 RepID=A0A6A3V7P1_9STRA|nr:hypothetical protein PF005_g30805 [Phytophthora fragariae]KAE9266226.1 hypothetical protein PF001_g30568 [Phytophthora fragariae]